MTDSELLGEFAVVSGALAELLVSTGEEAGPLAESEVSGVLGGGEVGGWLVGG
jgi:hypothetical protein